MFNAFIKNNAKNEHMRKQMYCRIFADKKQELAVQASGSKYYLDALRELPDLAFGAGDFEGALKYCEELSSFNFEVSPHDRRRCQHRADMIKGLIAFKKGDRTAAQDFMLKSIRSDQFEMPTYRPDLRLASEFLHVGERDAVLQYLSACLDYSPYSFRYWRLYVLVYLRFLPNFGRLDDSESRLDRFFPRLFVGILRPLEWLSSRHWNK